MALRRPVPLARYVAEQTCDLDAYAANQADRMLAGGDPAELTRRQARRIVDEQRLYDDPDRAVAEEQNALAAAEGRAPSGNTPATCEVVMNLDTPVAEAFDDKLSEVAHTLRGLGETDDFEILRARAVGILADPQTALDLLPRPAPMIRTSARRRSRRAADPAAARR